ncbi:hypothetical protein [Pseudomonas kurunegalensis]|uniref:hypothetical protein n=1 Tax=Pseudomonas kurunegalensis TaxID=485880 RepID=UPI002570A299|nr:hypothetical protein [Pseudomonas kurunegalensis]WJD60568.1 hypothetical protein QQ992_16660 [Pseudomonas kurunegalensis]
MSGQQTLQELDRIVGTTNELLLSPEVKMMDVGGGVIRPTNAMVMTNLATLLGGAMPYASVALGLAGTTEGTNFSVLSSADDEYVNVYRKSAGVAVFVDTYPNAKKVKQVQDSTQFAVETAPPRNMSETHPWALTDELLRVILGVRTDGIVDAILDRMPGLSLVGDFAWALCDQNDTVILGIKWSGEVVFYQPPASAATSMAWVEGAPGQRDVWVLSNGIPYQLTSDGDNSEPLLSSGVVNYLRRYNTVSAQSAQVPSAGSVAGYVTKLLHILFNGQSLMRGIGSGAAITTQPPAANRLLTLNDGVQLADETGTLSAGMVAPFKPLTARSLESPALQAAANINRNRGLPANCGLLTSDHSRGAQGITSLNKGTIPYNNSITAATAAKVEADRLGYGYEIPFVGWNQGQHDGGMAAGVYIGHLLQLQTDYDADLRAVSGQLNTIPMLLTQMSNWTAPAYNRSFSNIPHEQLQAALENPEKFVMAGPQYSLPSNTDGIHLPAASYARDGVMVARAARAIINKRIWLPLHCLSAKRTGVTVDLRFHVPTGPLVIDTVNVLDPGFYGLRWIDSTSSATVTKVEKTGFDTLRLTLSNEPTGTGQMVGIADIGVAGSRAGPTTGARTCIRDSAPDLDATGTPVYNWACHQRIQVTN